MIPTTKIVGVVVAHYQSRGSSGEGAYPHSVSSLESPPDAISPDEEHYDLVGDEDVYLVIDVGAIDEDGNPSYVTINTDDAVDDMMAYASAHGQLGVVKLALELGATDYNMAMAYAAGGNHVDIVYLMLELKASDYNWGLLAAASRGHYKMAETMVLLGATDYDTALELAAEGGHIDVVILMLDLGADVSEEAIRCAAAGGHDRVRTLLMSV